MEEHVLVLWEPLFILLVYAVVVKNHMVFRGLAVIQLSEQLVHERYEKNSTIFTSNKAFSNWNEVFSDITIASAILDRILHHCQVVSIKGESYRLKERKEVMKQKQLTFNTLFAEPANP